MDSSLFVCLVSSESSKFKSLKRWTTHSGKSSSVSDYLPFLHLPQNNSAPTNYETVSFVRLESRNWSERNKVRIDHWNSNNFHKSLNSFTLLSLHRLLDLKQYWNVEVVSLKTVSASIWMRLLLLSKIMLSALDSARPQSDLITFERRI